MGILYLYMIYNKERDYPCFIYKYDDIDLYNKMHDEFQKIYDNYDLAERCTFRIYKGIYNEDTKEIKYTHVFQYSYNPKIVNMNSIIF